MTTTPEGFAYLVSTMTAEQQNNFFKTLKSTLSEEDYNATVQFISLYGMFTNPDKYYAMREAVKEMVVAELFPNK